MVAVSKSKAMGLASYKDFPAEPPVLKCARNAHKGFTLHTLPQLSPQSHRCSLTALLSSALLALPCPSPPGLYVLWLLLSGPFFPLLFLDDSSVKSLCDHETQLPHLPHMLTRALG